ncbi:MULTISPECIES: hypothetical protein [unclassified Paenibacillus]|nr:MULTISPECIES: hypothetical protein [unclassified Paenibacillus]MBP1155640.1 sensor histidine kinase regulating citrate/malate metabolism [Paenibacillus sp. PvP091]MBP1168974.1 sensor histidine kinase regulating citrate/malate metabolism [Paenibacillus sp. PvR098]MBP2440002.1 sensor histidine kinase regulating citrate/malate metabolism [Paenibacillus sp. PvP052]
METLIEHHSSEEKKVMMFLSDLGTDLMIECEDNGPGIPANCSDRPYL